MTPGLTGDLVQARRDVEVPSIRVRLSVAADGPTLEATSVRLRSDAFPDAEPAPGVALRAGSGADVPVVVGAPACTGDTGDAGDSGAEADAEDGARLPAVVVLTLADGTTATADLPDADGYLARLHAEACVAARVLDAATTLAWDPVWTTTGTGADERAVAVLHLGPVAAGRTVELTGIGRSTLFAYRVLEPLPVRLGPGQSASVAVALDPVRCDAHAVGEDKRGFAPLVDVAVDGGDPGEVRVWVPRPERATGYAALRAACDAGALTG